MTLSTRQNEHTQSSRLTTMRQLYSKAAALSAGTALIALVLALSGPIAEHYFESARPWLALIGICFAALEVLFLKGREKALRQSAAVIHEQFDCDVLALPWNPIAVEAQPSAERVAATIDDSTPPAEVPPDRINPYPSEVDAGPIVAGRLICQRANLYSDSELRRPYAVMLWMVALGVPLLLIVWALASGRDVAALLIVFAAGLPLVLWTGQEARDQNDAAERVHRLRKSSDDIWKTLIGEVLRQPTWERLDEDRYLVASRTLQDQIYLHRVESPKVPDWFYKQSRERSERQTSGLVRELVEEFQRAKPGR
jgi:cytochrome c biogenesis protein CcdA